MSYFRIWKDTQGKYRLTLRGGNNEVIFTTEGYNTKAGLLNAKRVITSTTELTRVVDATLTSLSR